jgi:glycyl-tRNA synthetase
MSDKSAKTDDLMEKIVSLCKRRGFVYQGSEIYGGLAGTWDYGPLGVLLKDNIKAVWRDMFIDRKNVYPVDASLIMPGAAWEATGFTSTFADPLVKDKKTGTRFRADHLLEENGIDPKGMSVEQMSAVIQEKGIKSPEGNSLEEVKKFNLLFPVHMGASDDSASLAYLRGETAQGMFVNFKNILDSLHPKLPFGLGQIGKAFRNEIAPRDFIFRLRELEQMEVEYFIKASEWEDSFEDWRATMHEFANAIGLPKESLHELEVGAEDRAHYSKRTIDFEFDFPFGRKELWGLAYRTDFDLSSHSKASGVDLSYFDEETKERFTPHVIEPSLGVERTLLAILSSAYKEDEMGEEKRVYLALPPKIAPYKAMVSPLLKNKPELVAKAKEVRKMLQKEVHPWIVWDDNGNIGKRYRRQDEIGTPWCITVDFDTLGENPDLLDTVTLRHRDTGEQERVPVAELAAKLKAAIQG